MQVVDKSKSEGYSLWTAIFPISRLTGLYDGTLKNVVNNESQLNPYFNFQEDVDPFYRDLFNLLVAEGIYNDNNTSKAFIDFINQKPNTWFDSHIMIAAPSATRWISP